MNPWTRLVAGAPTRKTRLHDELGNRVSLDRLLRNGPHAIVSSALRLAFDRRPVAPWISYDARAIIERFLSSDRSVLEFGSGMSTVWYAQHAGSVVSIEDYAPWRRVVAALVAPFPHVDYRFAKGQGAYIAQAPDRLYDLIMIDGSWRLDCASFAIAHLRDGGMIYLDNSDKAFGPDTGDIPAASALLRGFARDKGLAVREFTDFAPTQLFVQHGLMIGGA